jgi:hypothetical protein
MLRSPPLFLLLAAEFFSIALIVFVWSSAQPTASAITLTVLGGVSAHGFATFVAWRALTTKLFKCPKVFCV